MTERKLDGKIASTAEAAMQTQQAMEEMMDISGQSHNINYEKVFVEKEKGKFVEIEVPIDDIDLIHDFENEDLTEEGFRFLGLIDKEHDSTSDYEYELKSRNKLPVVVIYMDENQTENDIEIICPYTGSNEVYQIDSETWASYETDQPFTVVLQSVNPD